MVMWRTSISLKQPLTGLPAVLLSYGLQITKKLFVAGEIFLCRGGGIALHAFWEESWVSGFALQSAAARHDVVLTIHQPTGTEDKMTKLLEDAGFSDVRIDQYEAGRWISLEDALKGWDGMVREEFPFSPPLFQVSDDVREAIKEDYEKYLRDSVTTEGVWEDRTTFMTYARNLSTC